MDLEGENMRLLIQRSTEPVPYRGAYFRLAATEGESARGAVVLPPLLDGGDEAEALARLLGLALALGDPPGGPPIRQYWLQADGSIRGKANSELGARQAAEAERLARRVRSEWDRFLANALARLRGEPRGDAHFRYPAEDWDVERPAVQVTAWPPLEGERLPTLE